MISHNHEQSDAPTPSQEDATVPLLNISSGLSAGDKNGDSMSPSYTLKNICKSYYGVLSPFGETQIVKHRKAEARNEMKLVQSPTI